MRSPIESACKDCWITKTSGFPLMTWEAYVQEKASHPEFARKAHAAGQVLKGERKKEFAPQEVGTVGRCGYRIESQHLVLSVAEFEKRFSCKPEDVKGVVAKVIFV